MIMCIEKDYYVMLMPTKLKIWSLLRTRPLQNRLYFEVCSYYKDTKVVYYLLCANGYVKSLIKKQFNF